MKPDQNPKKQEGSRIPVVEGEWQGKKVKFRADRIVVGLKGPSDVAASTVAKAICDAISETLPDARVLRYPRRTRVAVFRVPEGSDIPALAQQIAQRDDVRYAEPDFVGEIGVTPDDPKWGDQWGPEKINTEGAWDIEKGASGILIGIIDTGLATATDGALNHPDLDDSSRYILGTDFVNDDALPRDDHAHGTHVAGTAAAMTDNSEGIAGINWQSPVYVCKVFDDVGFGSQSDFEAAIEEIVDYALDNNLMVVVNLSAGWTSGSSTLRDACEYVNDNGMVLCAIAHNDYGSSVRFPAAYSADYEGVICVGSTDSDDTVSSFSNVGPELTVVAPGRDILSTMPTYDVTATDGGMSKDYDEMTGTSMACPHVTGLASLVWSREPKQTNEQIRDVLINTAKKLGTADFDDSWGYGRIDAEKAVLKAGWDVTLETPALEFLDVPEGETTVRAVKLSVKSFHATTFEIVSGPSAEFAAPFANSVSLGKSTDYDTPREAYLWISYTGTVAGDSPTGTVTVRCVETEKEWDIGITANTIARPTACIMLALDRSGSMGFDSGVSGLPRRIDVLRYSANILKDVLHEGNGMGIVAFDQDPHDVLVPVAGPVGPVEDFFDPGRTAIRAAIDTFDYNPAGSTSIGDGIERAHERLGAVGDYDVEAILVFTDGHENTPQYIADVADLIDDRVYAVGLGTSQVIQPTALNEITNGTGGYTVLTDALDDDDQFKLAKYFLQIQAAVMNEDIVVDPTGWIGPRQVRGIPFRLNEADISTDVILMLPSQGLVQLGIEAPDGTMITPATAAASAAVTYATGRNVSFYRFTLPQPVSSTAEVHAGLWHAVLVVDYEYFNRYLNTLDDQPELLEHTRVHGVPFTLLVHSYSNLRMRVSLAQTSYVPGATLNLTAALTEYGAPLMGDASVRALLTRPDGNRETLALTKTEPGIFAASTIASHAGIYEFRVIADGFSLRRSRFSREQVVTGFVWRGGDQPQPSTRSTADISDAVERTLCRLLHCLRRSMSGELRKQWMTRGIDIDALVKCYCARRQSNTEALQAQRFTDAQVLEYLSAALKVASRVSSAGTADRDCEE